MTDLNEQETVAEQTLTIACSAVGAHWKRDFPVCVEHRLWGSKSSTAEKMSHRQTFDRIRPGQLGIAVHGFGWQSPARPPRNAKGAAYGPRAPFEHFVKARFSEFVLFEVERPAYESRTKVWSPMAPDDWDLRVPLNIYVHERGVDLRMDEIDPAIAEAIRMSGIYASMPWVIAPAMLGGTARRMPAPGDPTDVLGKRACRREAGAMRDGLLAGRSIAPCAFCERDCLAEDLEAAHLKSRCVCDEDERLDPHVAVLACVSCHHCFDAGAILVEDTGVIRTTHAASGNEWRRETLRRLDGRAFSCFAPSNERYLAWHRSNVAEPAAQLSMMRTSRLARISEQTYTASTRGLGAQGGPVLTTNQ